MTENAQLCTTSPRLRRLVLFELEYPVPITQVDGSEFLLRELVLDPARAPDLGAANGQKLSDADKVLQSIAVLAGVTMDVVDSLDTADLLTAIDHCHEIYRKINAGLLSAGDRAPLKSISEPPFRKKFSS